MQRLQGIIGRDPVSWAAYGVILLIMAWAMLIYGYTDHYYVSCPEDAIGRCFNPLYGECDAPACTYEYLWPGDTYGEPPPPILSYAVGLMVLVAIAAIIWKHRARLRG